MSIIKTEKEGFYKDNSTGGVINKDNKALQAYKARKMRLSKTMKMEERIEALEKEVSILKELILNG